MVLRDHEDMAVDRGVPSAALPECPPGGGQAATAWPDIAMLVRPDAQPWRAEPALACRVTLKSIGTTGHGGAPGWALRGASTSGQHPEEPNEDQVDEGSQGAWMLAASVKQNGPEF